MAQLQRKQQFQPVLRGIRAEIMAKVARSSVIETLEEHAFIVDNAQCDNQHGDDVSNHVAHQ